MPRAKILQDPAIDVAVVDATALRMAVWRFARQMRHDGVRDGLSERQLSVLIALKRFAHQTLTDLADREEITTPAMHRTVRELEAAGWVQREADGADGRKVNIAVTAAGAAITAETLKRRDEWIEARLNSLSDEELRVLGAATGILQKMAHA